LRDFTVSLTLAKYDAILICFLGTRKRKRLKNRLKRLR
jgi:hypothetical protein